MLSYYGGNVTKALLHLYPNIGLEPSKFPEKPSIILLFIFINYSLLYNHYCYLTLQFRKVLA